MVLELNVFVAFITFPPGFLCFDSKTRATKVVSLVGLCQESARGSSSSYGEVATATAAQKTASTSTSFAAIEPRQQQQQNSLETKHTPSSFPCATQGFTENYICYYWESKKK